MKKKLASLLVVLALVFTTLTGCESMGRATGQAADKAEEGAQEFEEGYEEGRN